MRASLPGGGRAAAAAAVLLSSAVLPPAAPARAAPFASSVPQGGYTRGNVFIAGGQPYDDPQVALGPPPAVISPGTAFAGVHSPFNAAFAPEDLVVFGRGGSLTLQLESAVPVGPGPEVGVFTSAGLPDQAFPDGLAASPARTFAFDEYGAERTAVVEVAATAGNFVSLGRVTFDVPTNYFANATYPYQFPAPDPAVVADFGKPFTAGLSSFSGKTYAEILEALDGSAGGTWVDVPAGAGVSEVNFVRLSDPLWLLPDGSLAQTRTSRFDPSFVKPADLFVDAVSGVPEPSAAAFITFAGGGLLCRRRRYIRA